MRNALIGIMLALVMGAGVAAQDTLTPPPGTVKTLGSDLTLTKVEQLLQQVAQLQAQLAQAQAAMARCESAGPTSATLMQSAQQTFSELQKSLDVRGLQIDPQTWQVTEKPKVEKKP